MQADLSAGFTATRDMISHGNGTNGIEISKGENENPALVTDRKLDPASPLNGQGAGHGGAPKVHKLR